MPRSLHQSKQFRGGFLFRSLDFPLLADRLGCKMQVFRRKNGIWYARFTLNGKRLMRSIHLSTDKVDRDVALRKTYEIMLEVEQEQRLGIQKRTIPTLAVFAEKYLGFAETNKARSTFLRDTNRLNKLLKVFGKSRLDTMTQEKFELFMRKRSRDGAEAATVNHDLKLLRHVMNKAVDWGYLAENPLRRIKLLKEPPPGKTGICLSVEEEERLLYECGRSRNSILETFVVTALYTAMRPSEILRLTWDDLDLDLGLIIVRETKNNEMREIGMHDKVLKCLEALKNKYPFSSYVFCKPNGSPVKDISEAFENAARRAGMRTDRRKVRIYDMRHTAITRLGMSFCNEVEIASISGHKTLRVLRRYTHFPAEYKREIVNRIGAKVVQQKSRKSSIS